MELLGAEGLVTGTEYVRSKTVASVRISLPDTASFCSVQLLCTVLAVALLGSTSAYAQSGQFQHVVVIFQENRSTDNLFGSNPSFEPGVDLATSGTNSKGQQIPLGPVPLASCYDLMHGHSPFLRQYDGGKMDGADKVGVLINPGCQVPSNPQFKYVDNSTGEIQPYFDIATQYGWANYMFQTNQGGSYPAHQFIFSGTSAPSTNSDLFAAENPTKLPGQPTGCIAAAGQTVKLIDPQGQENSSQYPCFEHPTLSDLLEGAQSPIDWRYYTPSPGSIWTAPNSIQHICVPQMQNGQLVCAGSDWVEHVVIPQTTILTDAKNCNLPPVSWVMPDGGDSDHAGTNKGTGPSWVTSIVNAIGLSTCGYWQNTAIFITWDDWGGWYDHVPPYAIGQYNGWGISYVYGFRVPLLVVSAYTPAGYVDNSNYDFGSILRFIETVFGPPGFPLGPIGPGDYADAYANDLQSFFTLTTPRKFRRIHATYDASYFLRRSRPPIDPDDDGDEE